MNTAEEKKKYQAHEIALDAAQRDLRAEMTKALLSNVVRIIRTPAFGRTLQPCSKAVANLCAANDELQIVEQLLRLASMCANGDDPATRLPAQALLASIAYEHAEMHKAEWAQKCEEARNGF